MRKLLLIITTLTIFLSCQNPWETYPYTTFEQSIEEITNDYGEPKVIKETCFYDDGTVRNQVIYFDIDPPEYYGDDFLGRPQYYTTISAEVWHQPYSDKNSLVKHDLYGWELLHWTKGKFSYIE